MRRSGSPGIIGSTGADRSRAWIWDFSSTQSTSAFSGGSRYSPTTSRTLSMNCGSLLILKVSTRCGLSPNAFQIRPTVDFDSPDSLAIDARDQCVASSGWRSSVATTTASICSSPIVRGAPGRGSSASPSKRLATNRPRHLHTICCDTPNSAATSLLDLPAAQPNTIRHRCASACADFGRRAHRCSVSRSSSVNTTAVTGLPRFATHQVYNYSANFWRRTLGGSCRNLQRRHFLGSGNTKRSHRQVRSSRRGP